MSDLTEAQMDEYRAASGEERGKDDKGRDMVETMTDRELLKESVVLLRAFGDALETLGQNPMLKAMMPKGLVR